MSYEHYTTKKRFAQGAAALILAGGVLLGGSVLGGRDTARAVEDEGPSVLGYLVIPGREEKPVRIHDKRTAVKAERVEIELETHGECTEPEPECTETQQQRTETQQQSEERNLRYLGNYKVTGYDICVSCCGSTKGITASGTQATVGRTCAAGKDLPFGTVLYIDGIGYRTVEDRGGGVNVGHIDVLCENHSECYSITGYRDVWIVEG